MMKRALRLLGWAEAAIIAAVMLAISVLVFGQVLTRYVFLYSAPWIEELTRFLMIWMILLGSAYAVRTKQHIAIDLIDSFVRSPRALRLASLLVSVIGLLFSIVLAVLSYIVVERTASYEQLSGAMRLPMQFANGSFLVASILMAVHYLEQMVSGPAVADPGVETGQN